MCAGDYCQRVKAARAAMSRAAGDASVKAYLPILSEGRHGTTNGRDTQGLALRVTYR